MALSISVGPSGLRGHGVLGFPHCSPLPCYLLGTFCLPEPSSIVLGIETVVPVMRKLKLAVVKMQACLGAEWVGGQRWAPASPMWSGAQPGEGGVRAWTGHPLSLGLLPEALLSSPGGIEGRSL